MTIWKIEKQDRPKQKYRVIGEVFCDPMGALPFNSRKVHTPSGLLRVWPRYKFTTVWSRRGE